MFCEIMLNAYRFFTSALGMFLCMALVSSSLKSQTLDDQYQSLLQRSETYNEYKVIPKERLDAFWDVVTDSSVSQKSALSALSAEIDGKEQQLNQQEVQITQLNTALSESLAVSNSINFLGMLLSKWSYHLIVWSLIALLLIFGVGSYILFLRSNRLTSQHKRELTQVSVEYEDHKSRARETQAKLKRELQTAINKLDANGLDL